jgi:hypothetical protein
MDQAQSSKGISVNIITAAAFAGELVNTTGNLIRLTTSNSNLRQFNSIAFTYGGTSSASNCFFYTNGNLNSVSTSDSLSATVKSGKSLLIGGRHNGLNKSTFLTVIKLIKKSL